jgi:hypothetical protein
LKVIRLEDFDLLHGVLEPGLTELQEFGPALVRGEGLLKGKLTGLHARNDGFQFGKRGLETQGLF